LAGARACAAGFRGVQRAVLVIAWRADGVSRVPRFAFSRVRGANRFERSTRDAVFRTKLTFFAFAHARDGRDWRSPLADGTRNGQQPGQAAFV
jgi:hypothetical protein